MKFEISNIASGQVLGSYQAASELEAYRAMLKDAGYSESRLLDDMDWNEIPADISITQESR